MEFIKMSKTELLEKCAFHKIKKCKSKSKKQLIDILTHVSSTQQNSITELNSISGENSVMEQNMSSEQNTIDIKNKNGLEYLKSVSNESIDLILTDPPYIISKDSGMNKHYNNIKFNEENQISQVKTENEWEIYKKTNKISDDKNKENFMKFGSIYGKKYSVKTDYGSWDSDFTLEHLDTFIKEYYEKLKKGGTLIMFFDLWKITDLKNLLEKYDFKQIRYIEWIKTNHNQEIVK